MSRDLQSLQPLEGGTWTSLGRQGQPNGLHKISQRGVVAHVERKNLVQADMLGCFAFRVYNHAADVVQITAVASEGTIEVLGRDGQFAYVDRRDRCLQNQPRAIIGGSHKIIWTLGQHNFPGV